MRVVRLSKVVQVFHFWAFLSEGIQYEAKYLRYAHPLDTYRKILCHLVSTGDKAWVGLVLDESDKPVSFVMAHDVTPLFATDREFEVSMFYFKPGFKQTIKLLQDRLDAFCHENGIGRYYLTTSSFSSSAARVFNDSWRGLVRSNTVFKRKVS